MNLPAGNWDAEFVRQPRKALDMSAEMLVGHLGFRLRYALMHRRLTLARVEMQVAFATLARRLPGLQLAVPPDELLRCPSKPTSTG